MGSRVADTFVVDVDIDSEPGEFGDRNTIGGWPVLDAGQAWPTCACGTRLALYFQLEVPAEVPHFGGDQLLVFHCPAEGDTGGHSTEPQLPENYWDNPPGADSVFWRILLQRNGMPRETADPHFEPRRLELYAAEDRVTEPGFEGPLNDFKVGGTPRWVQAPEHYRCACGEDMVFLCQVYEDFPFADYADPDPDESVDCAGIDDGLFLGNQDYILACPGHCDPAAAWPVCQN
ncbi:hypothetical protein [Nocardia sp. XZ_19_385]|uniref:hypothetical protein n=1 Tax=Nocardia sp. XZ_19_385 TaxID=2769488 RepID=UPI0018903145|nr:hypothetical protein [Nocardia sp. XZ_19_385]